MCRPVLLSVIPAKAEIQVFKLVTEFLDSGFHRSDDFLRVHQTWVINQLGSSPD